MRAAAIALALALGWLLPLGTGALVWLLAAGVVLAARTPRRAA